MLIAMPKLFAHCKSVFFSLSIYTYIRNTGRKKSTNIYVTMLQAENK